MVYALVELGERYRRWFHMNGENSSHVGSDCARARPQTDGDDDQPLRHQPSPLLHRHVHGRSPQLNEECTCAGFGTKLR